MSAHAAVVRLRESFMKRKREGRDILGGQVDLYVTDHQFLPLPSAGTLNPNHPYLFPFQPLNTSFFSTTKGSPSDGNGGSITKLFFIVEIHKLLGNSLVDLNVRYI